HSEMRLGAVLAHFGIGRVPHFTAQRALDEGSVVPVLSDWELLGPYQGTAYVLYPPSRRLAPKLRAFIDHLAEALR
ncbi:MAG TPA: LysR substrate-binding domain-containing protein, partial [Burkholderiaceae bacterium]|nr:LysR substrate-binding domain-containing protein [Burkholderiaceae bacterium]